MHIELSRRLASQGWSVQGGAALPAPAQWVLYFGPTDALQDGTVARELRECHPQAVITGCSTGTTLLGADVADDEVCCAALHFEHTRVEAARAPLRCAADSRACGQQLGKALAAPDLALVVVLSQGSVVNGSELLAGLTHSLGPAVPVVGGLAGDGSRFQTTLVGLGDRIASDEAVAIGLYGHRLQHTAAALGGWESFGPPRRVTGAAGNVLNELDGRSALDLYEHYLGEEAAGLPGTALLYPLRVWPPGQPEQGVVRTVLAIDRESRTMTFAGDLPQGWSAQLMRGHHEHLVDGAQAAARTAQAALPGSLAGPPAGNTLALLVSCVGRRLLMGQRTSDEAEAIAEVLPAGAQAIGFYSYGELSPSAPGNACDLHNQTMAVTLIAESAS